MIPAVQRPYFTPGCSAHQLVVSGDAALCEEASSQIAVVDVVSLWRTGEGPEAQPLRKVVRTRQHATDLVICSSRGDRSGDDRADLSFSGGRVEAHRPFGERRLSRWHLARPA